MPTQVAAVRDGQNWVDIHEALESAMGAATKIKPNREFPTGWRTP